ncbi:helix-turn-helix transcriptional regulator [Lacticaseibacillus paracasei]|uniref:helix-turn-helix transcriptional regulator n=1 Tax=Lacticaseibacillus paracasei TaxID=1597 RepID=UPI001899D587|nr:helix-turn-helix transcriptional regulator [Lacticaseibacillus paracasei]
MTTLFDRVKDLADKKKISIVELEEKLNFGRNYLYKWKSPTANPSKEAVEKVADFFHVSTDYLFGRTIKLSERLRSLRSNMGFSQSEVANKIGVSSYSYSAYERGSRMPDMETLKSISALFDVSIDYLLGVTDKRHYYSLTEKDYKDIEAILNDAMNGIRGKTGVNYFKNGGELTDEDRALLEASMKQTIILAKELAKKKFTPKKYRGSESDDAN